MDALRGCSDLECEYVLLGTGVFNWSVVMLIRRYGTKLSVLPSAIFERRTEKKEILSTKKLYFGRCVEDNMHIG